MIDFRLGGNEPVYEQIADQIRLAVASGRLKAGDRLEPVRDLAERLAVNASTVARAYRMLEQEGVIATNRRRGSIIAPRNDVSDLRAVRGSRLRASMEKALVEALAQGYTPDEVEAAFAVQLAAWRERRWGPIPGERETSATDRLHSFAGSHDLALEALWTRARQLGFSSPLNIRYVGSLDGLLALMHGEVGMAGTHLLDEETGDYNIPILRRLFIGQELCVITLAERQQGLIVRPGQGKRLQSFADLAQPGIRIINRQPGSGTRALLDFQLRRLSIPHESLLGYDTETDTHLAVAEAVAAGEADTGLGLAAAAEAFDLDFVPLARERYDLVVHAHERSRTPIKELLDVVKSPQFRSVVAAIQGYDSTHTGEETRL